MGDVDEVIEAIVYLYTESRRLTKEMARAKDLTGPQLTVVKMLEQIGDLSLSELSERIRAQNSTVTGIIDRMVRENLVVRERSKEDRRVVYLRMTSAGRALLPRLRAAATRVLNRGLAGFGTAEIEALKGYLNRMIENGQPRHED